MGFEIKRREEDGTSFERQDRDRWAGRRG